MVHDNPTNQTHLKSIDSHCIEEGVCILCFLTLKKNTIYQFLCTPTLNGTHVMSF